MIFLWNVLKKFEGPANSLLIIFLPMEGFDNFFWCEDCQTDVDTECSTHGPVIKIRDKLILSRAKLTVPYMLTVKVLEYRVDSSNVHGVFAKKIVQKSSQFGPLDAPFCKEDSSCRPFEIKLFTSDGVKTYDTTDENACNWMMFVRPARNKVEENLVVVQHMGHIYFITTKVIKIDEELRVSYSSKYRKKLLELSKQMEIPELPSEDGFFEDSAGPSFTSVTSTHLKRKINLRDKKFQQKLRVEHAAVGLSVIGTIIPWTTDGSNELTETTPENTRRLDDESLNVIVDGDIQEIFPLEIAIDDDQAMHLDRPPEYEAEQPQLISHKLTAKSKKQLHNRIGRHKPNTGRQKSSQSNNSSMECSVCKMIFPSASLLQKHMLHHTGEKPYKCSFEGCGKAFITVYKLNRHETVHGKGNEFKCVYCKKVFRRRDHLKSHLNVHSHNKEEFRCSLCDKVYYSVQFHRLHMAYHDLELGLLTCRVCQKSCADRSDLETHLHHHAGRRSVKDVADKKHQCPHCELRFFCQKDVKRHLVVHTKVKDFMCHQCPKTFSRRDHLARHIQLVHTPGELGVKEPRGKGTSRKRKHLVQSQQKKARGVTAVKGLNKRKNAPTIRIPHQTNLLEGVSEQEAQAALLMAQLEEILANSTGATGATVSGLINTGHEPVSLTMLTPDGKHPHVPDSSGTFAHQAGSIPPDSINLKLASSTQPVVSSWPLDSLPSGLSFLLSSAQASFDGRSSAAGAQEVGTPSVGSYLAALNSPGISSPGNAQHSDLGEFDVSLLLSQHPSFAIQDLYTMKPNTEFSSNPNQVIPSPITVVSMGNSVASTAVFSPNLQSTSASFVYSAPVAFAKPVESHAHMITRLAQPTTTHANNSPKKRLTKRPNASQQISYNTVALIQNADRILPVLQRCDTLPLSSVQSVNSSDGINAKFEDDTVKSDTVDRNSSMTLPALTLDDLSFSFQCKAGDDAVGRMMSTLSTPPILVIDKSLLSLPEPLPHPSDQVQLSSQAVPNTRIH